MRFHPNIGSQLKNSLSMIGMSFCMFSGYCIYEGNEKFYYKILLPTSHLILSPETAHKLAVLMGKHNLFPKFSNFSYPDLSVKLFGLRFSHPVGIAAGFDKHGESILGLLNAGFSHVEVGSVTPEPQSGNDSPRVFRLVNDEAVINRYGFNSVGHQVVYERLINIDWKDKGVVGINLGINKHTNDPAGDYVKGVKLFGEVCDYLVINVSSPNTPGLRLLQKENQLRNTLSQVMRAREALVKKTAILLKVSPDETDEDVKNIVKVSLEHNIDGFVVCNTTNSRDSLSSSAELIAETGGLSGKPLRDKSTELISRISNLTNGRVPIVGVGGVSSGKDAWLKLMAGASLIQLYTSMVYYGPPIVKKVTRELDEELRNSEYTSLYEFLSKRNLEKQILVE